MKIKIGDTARLREGNLLCFGTVEGTNGEYAYIKINGQPGIVSAMLGTFEIVDYKKEMKAVLSSLRKLARRVK